MVSWGDIAARLEGRTATSCRLHYQKYLEKRLDWDEEKKNEFARRYEMYCTKASLSSHVVILLMSRTQAQAPDVGNDCGRDEYSVADG